MHKAWYFIQALSCGSWRDSFFISEKKMDDSFKLDYSGNTDYSQARPVRLRNLRTTVIDFKIDELGDIILLFSEIPWLECHSPSEKQWVLRRHYYGMFHRPRQLYVGKSGTSYVNDPDPMMVHRIAPGGDVWNSIHCAISPDVFCLDSLENVIVGNCSTSPGNTELLVYNWTGDVVFHTTLYNTFCRVLLCTRQQMHWVSVDFNAGSTKIYELGGGKSIAEIPVFVHERNFAFIGPDDGFSYWNNTTKTVDVYKKLE
jgi:hypothetical protein